MAGLFESFHIKNVAIKNRICVPPLVCYGWSDETGMVTEKNIEHYREIARGGAGLIIQEATCVCKEGRLSWDQLGIWSDDHIPGLKKIVDAVHSEGVPVFLQIHHAGVLGVGGDLVAPSEYACEHREQNKHARERAEKEIYAVARLFIEAAQRAVKAGYDGVEIHGCHGYLLCEFTLKKYNKRNDEYGFDNIEDRYRFPLEVVRAVREAVGEDYPIYYRLGVNMDDIEDVKKGARMLEMAGVDVLDISSAFDASTSLEDKEHEFNEVVTSAKIIKENVNIPVIAVNRISTPDRAEKLLKEGYCDFTAIGRELLSDYRWAYKAKNNIPINYCYHCKPKCKLNGGDNKCPNLIKNNETLY